MDDAFVFFHNEIRHMLEKCFQEKYHVEINVTISIKNSSPDCDYILPSIKQINVDSYVTTNNDVHSLNRFIDSQNIVYTF